MKKISHRLLHPAWVIILFVTIVSIQTSCEYSKEAFGQGAESPLKGSAENIKAWEIQKVFRKIAELYHDRVVFISTEQTVKIQPHPFFDDPFFNQFFGIPYQNRPRTHKRRGLGSGFIISRDGYVCTNHHVIQNVDKVTVKVLDKVYDAEVIGSDERTDIALLKIKSNNKFNPVFFGDSDKVNVGDWAIAIGNPFGLDKTFTVGVISAVARKDVDMMGGSQSHIQTDASINPGNSGGPLINIDGEVIGINRMIYSSSGGYMGIGFAIPINQAKIILEQLKAHKKVRRGFIGVQIVPFTEEYAKEIGLPKNEGALVGAVVPGSPADKGGIQVGDVIVKVNNTPIKEFSDLLQEVEKAPINSTLKVQVWRDKTTVNLFITVKERE
ncbi:MAG: trypsin-like peptidase domain-containing protein [Spirochaetes bacterium]|nr:trypsin-like peptidase domain-containing protein [Spirochaetota bacterium]